MIYEIIKNENEHLCSYDIKMSKNSSNYANIKEDFLKVLGKYGQVRELIPDSTITITTDKRLSEFLISYDITILKSKHNCDIDLVIK